MGIADLAMGLFGGGDPRDKVAAALAYQRNPNPMTQAAWSKVSGQPAGATPQPPGPGGPAPAPSPGGDAGGDPSQQGQPPAPPQPQAYTSPPDMVALYTQLAQRGQATASLDRNIGLLASGLDVGHPQGAQDITNTMNAQATADQAAYGPDYMKGAQAASDQMQTADIRTQGLAALPAIEQKYGLSHEEALSLFNNGKLDDLIQQYNTPDPTMKEYFEYVKEQKAAGKDPVDIATFRDKYSTTGREKLGLQMQWQAKTDADGKITLHGYQLGDRGTLHEVLDKDGQPLTAKPTEINTGTEIQFVNPYTQEVVGRKPIDVSGKEQQTKEGALAVTLPAADDITKRGTSLVDQIISDVDSGKGDLAGNTGLGYRFGAANWYPTTGHTASQLEQLKSINFLEAYTTLRGGGAISDPEGEKAQNAFAALKHPEWLTPTDLRNQLIIAKDAMNSANAAAHKAAGDTSSSGGGGGGGGDAIAVPDGANEGDYFTENAKVYQVRNGKMVFVRNKGAK